MKSCKGSVEGGKNFPRLKTPIYLSNAEPEPDDKEHDDPEYHVAHLQRVVVGLPQVALHRCLNGSRILPDFLVEPIERLDQVDGSDRGGGVLGGFCEVALLRSDGGFEAPGGQGEYND